MTAGSVFLIKRWGKTKGRKTPFLISLFGIGHKLFGKKKDLGKKSVSIRKSQNIFFIPSYFSGKNLF